MRGPAERRRLGLSIGIALLAGCAQGLAMADPWQGQALWWLQLGSLAVLAGCADDAPDMPSAAAVGWCFAIAWLGCTFWWLFISMHVYGGLPAWLAAPAVVALACFLALYHAGALAIYRWLAPRRPPVRALLFAACWTLAELARGSWFTGFPWGAGGYAQVDGPFAALAKIGGVYGLGFVAAALAWLIADAMRHPRSVPRWIGCVVTGSLLVAAGQLAQAPQSTANGGLTVSLLQGNIAQDEKFQGGTGVPMALGWYGEQLRRARAALVVGPETALPLLPQQLPDGYWSGLVRRFGEGGQAVLLGVPLGSHREGYTNSVVGLKPGAATYRYDKHHLVPFGEFVPPLFRWFTDLMHIPLGDFERGGVGQPSFEWQGQRLAPNICYEDLFGEELAARFAAAASAPTVFVNVSNIAWFGDTVAIDQHLHISRMRAIEFERPMVRATNTGATALIDHQGRVLHMLPRLTRGTLEGEVEGRTGTTVYAWWAARFGLWPLWLGCGALLAAAWLGRRGRMRAPAP